MYDARKIRPTMTIFESTTIVLPRVEIVFSDEVQPGLVEISADQKTARMHPDCRQITLADNTRGVVLPSVYRAAPDSLVK